MSIKFKLYREFGALNSSPVFDAFESGLQSLGYQSVSTQEDVAVIWSVLWNGRMSGNQAVYHRSQQTNKPIIVLEVGGIQRGTTWKVGLNGINRGCFSIDSLDLSRAEKLGLTLTPWRNCGDSILICGQHERSLQWQGMPRTAQWVDETINTIRKHTDRRIVVRSHPRCPFTFLESKYQNVAREVPRIIPGSYDDYNLKFKDVHAVVNWSSNPGIRAVLNGIPSFVGPSSLAYNVANTSLENIENPQMPDRQHWLNKYAHTEWNLEEIAKGIPLARLASKIVKHLS
jgi:hypothetical protein